MRKTYWAIVEGEVEADEGQWSDRVRKVPGEARGEVVPADQPNAKRAILSFRVKHRFERMTWMEIILETGRYPQIRVQASAHGFPVVGDTLYGATSTFGSLSGEPRDRVISLHARDLAFRHPMTKEDVYVTAPLPETWSVFRAIYPAAFDDHPG